MLKPMRKNALTKILAELNVIHNNLGVNKTMNLWHILPLFTPKI